MRNAIFRRVKFRNTLLKALSSFLNKKPFSKLLIPKKHLKKKKLKIKTVFKPAIFFLRKYLYFFKKNNLNYTNQKEKPICPVYPKIKPFIK